MNTLSSPTFPEKKTGIASLISYHSALIAHLTEEQIDTARRRYWARILGQPRSGNNPRVASYINEPSPYND